MTQFSKHEETGMRDLSFIGLVVQLVKPKTVN